MVYKISLFFAVLIISANSFSMNNNIEEEPAYIKVCLDTQIKKLDRQIEYKDVEMDEYKIVCANESNVGTFGVGPCIVVCARGKNINGEIFLGLFHASSLTSAEDAFDSLYFGLIKKGCLSNSLEFLLAGGYPPSPGFKEGVYEAQMEYLNCETENGELFNVIEAKFNISKGETHFFIKQNIPQDSNEIYDGITLILTSESLFYAPDEY